MTRKSGILISRRQIFGGSGYNVSLGNVYVILILTRVSKFFGKLLFRVQAKKGHVKIYMYYYSFALVLDMTTLEN